MFGVGVWPKELLHGEKLTHLPAGLTEAGQNGRADVRPLHQTLVPQPGKNCGLGLCLRAFYK